MMPLGPFAPQFGFPLTATGATQITQGLTATVVGFAPPTSAVGFLLQNDSNSFSTVRWRIGPAANVTLGHQLEPGRDSGYMPFGGSTLTLCAVDGTTLSLIQLTWLISS